MIKCMSQREIILRNNGTFSALGHFPKNRGQEHEIFSMVILSLPLIQEGQLSVSGERMCTILVNRLED